MHDIKIELLELDAQIPTKAHPTDAGFDIYSIEDLTIAPHEFKKVRTGTALELPEGFEAQIRPRSGLAYKFGVTMLNGVGTIDANYRGEINVLLINHGSEAFKVTKGMRIAQMVVATLAPCTLKQVADINKNTDRGEGGFGSTGS